MRTLIFDFGNVIGFFDHHRTLRRLAAHTDLSMDVMMARFRATTLEDDYESGRLTSAAFLTQARQLFQLRCSDDEIAAAWSDIFEPNEAMHKLIVSLHGRCRLLLASNTNELHARQFRHQFADTLQHFHHLVLSHEIGARKPHRPFFAHCQQHASCAPHECLFIDDLPENVAGAIAFGWQGLVYKDIEEIRTRLCC